ncbi:hypothetical protein U1Q18_043115 [Sarracenia purpurea var. burkii]
MILNHHHHRGIIASMPSVVSTTNVFSCTAVIFVIAKFIYSPLQPTSNGSIKRSRASLYSETGPIICVRRNKALQNAGAAFPATNVKARRRTDRLSPRRRPPLVPTGLYGMRKLVGGIARLGWQREYYSPKSDPHGFLVKISLEWIEMNEAGWSRIEREP